MWLLLLLACDSPETAETRVSVELNNDGPDAVSLTIGDETPSALTEIAPFSSRTTPFPGTVDVGVDNNGDFDGSLLLTMTITAGRNGEVLETRVGEAEVVGCATEVADGTLIWAWSGLALEEGVHALSCL